MNRRNFLLASSTLTLGSLYGRTAEARRLGRRRGQCCPGTQTTRSLATGAKSGRIERATNIRAYFGDAARGSVEASASYHWWAHGADIHHSRGSAHSNGRWWVDDMHSSGYWTCWGPYVNLSAGNWTAAWNIYVEGSSAGAQVLAMDIVAFSGHVDIVLDKLFHLPSGQTEIDGSASLDFDLGEDFDGVEVRIRPLSDNTRVLIAKDLFISTR
jgi:hypothetical protein